MALPQRLSRPIQDPLFPVSPSSDRDMIAKFPTHLWTLIWSCTVQSRLCGGTTGLDYKFAPKANRRPSQSRASLKSARGTQVYEARNNRLWGKSRWTPRIGRILSYVTHIHTHAFWIGPPSTSAQNWRVAEVDNTGASGLWCELVK